MPRVNIIGAGPGSSMFITGEAQKAISGSCRLIGDRRVITPYGHLGKPVLYSASIEEISAHLDTCGENDEVAVLVSGDVGFFSLAKTLLAKVAGKYDIRLFCGIGSMQYFCSKLKTAWDDAAYLSLHGRSGNLIGTVMKNKKVFVLTGGETTPQSVCRTLCEYGLGSLKVSVGENLSYDNEKITAGTAQTLAEKEFDGLSVMMVFNDSPISRPYVTHGLPDEMFVRGGAPMTKQEIRAVSLSKLVLAPSDIAYDIGAGTGSVAVEMALQLADGFVYAVEKDAQAICLIEKNKKKFGTANLRIIPAAAPDCLAPLPRPDKVFVGGSGGRLREILDCVYGKNPAAGVVINAITLETLNEAVDYYRNRDGYGVEIVNIAVSKAERLGRYSLMRGQNPVYVITARAGAGDES